MLNSFRRIHYLSKRAMVTQSFPSSASSTIIPPLSTNLATPLSSNSSSIPSFIPSSVRSFSSHANQLPPSLISTHFDQIDGLSDPTRFYPDYTKEIPPYIASFFADPRLNVSNIDKITEFFEAEVVASASSSNSSTFQHQNSPFYITTPIFYVNGAPHLGHAYTSVIADILARYHRTMGRPVRFLSGTDEHGQKVEQTAKKVEQTPLQFASQNSFKFQNMLESLNCTNDVFIRTTDIRHKAAVNYLWNTLEKNGFIYKGSYSGYYSISDECFYKPSEIVDNKAPTGSDVTWIEEESYYFRLSMFKDKLLQYYKDNPDFIRPTSRMNEVISFIENGDLEDLSISRNTFEWGIKVPGDEKHVIYVWIDALTNYLTALGYPNTESKHLKTYWPASIQVVGKDILRFHAIYWPALLMATGLPLPKTIFAHGWWTQDGQKMSKTKGNVVDPLSLMSQYGSDYVRYYLAAEIPFGKDGDFSYQSFVHKVNNDLAHCIGNLVTRVITPIIKHSEGIVPSVSPHSDPSIPVGEPLRPEDLELLFAARNAIVNINNAMEKYDVRAFTEIIHHLGIAGNKYIVDNPPWELNKDPTNIPRIRTILYTITEFLRITSIYLQILTPNTVNRILDSLGVPYDYRSWESTQWWMPPGGRVSKPSTIFPRIAIDDDLKEKKIQSNIYNQEKLKQKKLHQKEEKPISEILTPEQYSQFLSQYCHISSVDDLNCELNRVTGLIKSLRSSGTCDKSELNTHVCELCFLKDRLKMIRKNCQ